ncbi:MAG TPA: ATP-binding protein [Stellaceae bacterium]|nr:ATP-binding protein [Stellaceae bacterium]
MEDANHTNPANARLSDTEPIDEGERFFRELADNAPVMIWRSGPDTLCDWFNKPWLDFVGRTMEQELGNGWAEGVHPDDFERCLKTYIGAFDARQPFSMTYRLRRADGLYRQILDNGAPFYRAGVFAGYFGSCIDVTEQQAAEAQLRQAQKMEAIGKLTGGVAHDFNNLLQVIGVNIEMLSMEIASNEKLHKRIEPALQAVWRGSKLASQLLASARRQPLSPKVINVGRLIRNADDMLRRALGEGVEIETVIAGGLWNTRVDPVQVETALLNLAINARDAMDGRGKLTIEAGNAFLDDNYAARHTEVTPGQYVMIAVSDTGCGIAPDILEKVFDPFFTTKPEGQGTGLGLSMVHGFVKQSGGHTKIYSELGEGSTVRVYLPRSREDEDIPIEGHANTVIHGTEIILLVEDDEDVRLTTAEMLSQLGYSVLRAKDADGALVIIESGAKIHLLFTDIVMPGTLRAPELARKAQQKIPGIAVLFTTGYADNATIRGGRLEGGINLITKPYARDELGRKLRQILQRRE